AQHVGVGLRVGDEVGDGGHRRVTGGRHDVLLDADDLLAVEGEEQLVEVDAVLAGRDHRAGGDGTLLGDPLGHLDRVVVGQVRVAGDDRVDVGGDAVDDTTEVGGGVGGRGQGRGRGPLVDEEHDHVGAVALAQVGGDPVGRLHHVGDLQVGDAGRGDQLVEVLGDGTHEADLDVAEVLHELLR